MIVLSLKSWPQRLSARLGQALPVCSVRAYLFLMVVAVSLPLAALVLVQTVRDSQHQRHMVDAGLLNTARALAVTVERELQASISALSILASSATLHGGDLAAFYEEARRVCQHQPWWTIDTGEQKRPPGDLNRRLGLTTFEVPL